MKIQVRLATIKDAQVIYDLLFQSSDETNFLAVDSKALTYASFSSAFVEEKKSQYAHRPLQNGTCK